jgi:peptide deformylase
MPRTRAPKIVQEGDPVLRAIAHSVPKKDFGSAKLKKLISDMSKALATEEYGVALAAPQIGASVRLFIVAPKVLTRDEEGEVPATPLAFINPVILRLSRRKKELHEGCLSVAGVYGWIKRHEKATVKAYDLQGKPFTYHGSDLLAEIFQHEIDHLDGILFIDKIERLDEEK